MMAAADGEAAEGEWRGGKAASAVSKDLKTLFTNEQIAAILPHRYPFLLVDKVIEFDAGKKAVGIKQVGALRPFWVCPDWLIDWLVDWLVGWLIVCLETHRVIGYLSIIDISGGWS